MTENLIDVMLQTVLDGGKLSLQYLQNSKPTLKSDNSVLTQADLAVSRLVRKNLAALLRTRDHILIDEEDKESGRFFEQAHLEQIPYIWVADPIDGTRNFANRMPMYGVSLGLLKDLRPWLGAVYFPMLDELFYSNGDKSYFVKAASSRQPQKSVINSQDQLISQQSIYYGSDKFFQNFNWDFSLCQMMLPSCAVLDLCWPSIGRGAGSFFNAHIWDFAGAWPIFRSAGLGLRSLTNGKVIEQLDTKIFLGKGDKIWRLNDYYVLSSARNFSIIRAAISKRHGNGLN